MQEPEIPWDSWPIGEYEWSLIHSYLFEQHRIASHAASTLSHVAKSGGGPDSESLSKWWSNAASSLAGLIGQWEQQRPKPQELPGESSMSRDPTTGEATYG